MRKKLFQDCLPFLILVASVCSSERAHAAGTTSVTATQTVNMAINATSNITTSGNPGTLTITLNPDGTGSSTDSSTTYTVVSNSGATGKLKISGAITSGGVMPSNTTLTINLGSKQGTSQGTQTLGITATDLVTSLPTLVSDTSTISYGFNVTNGWTIPAQTINRTVTLTLTSAS